MDTTAPKRTLGQSHGAGYRSPEPTMAALASWVGARGRAPGSLLLNFDRAGNAAKRERLTGTGL
jgi:hypothetical protein